MNEVKMLKDALRNLNAIDSVIIATIGEESATMNAAALLRQLLDEQLQMIVKQATCPECEAHGRHICPARD